jgi:hypothetical protein
MHRLFFTLALISLPVAAQIYTYTDEEGHSVFTDSPRSGSAQQVQIAPPNRMPAATPAPRAIAPETSVVSPIPGYTLLRILVPEPDATIRDNAGDLIVTATSEPALHAEHSYRLLLDGNPVGSIGRSPVFSLQNIDRGTHQIVVEIITPQGIIVERTPSQPFHMLRISLAQKRLAHPCAANDYGVRPECPRE